MTILALVESVDHVCCRYRIQAFLPALRAAGLQLVVQPISTDLRSRVRQFWSARDFDAVILQRKLLPGWQWSLLRARARRLVFDMDDAVMHRDSYHPRGTASRARMRRFSQVARESDCVLAGNPHLAELTRRAGAKPDNVTDLPTCVEPSDYRIAGHTKPRTEPLCMVWVGSSSTLRGLEQSASLWKTLGARHPWLRLRLISDRFAEFPPLETENVRWSQTGEADAIASADVGIAWMPDDAWSRGKCGLKVLQYQAAGLPVVANRVGVHKSLVIPGQTGFLADDAEEWSHAISTLRQPATRLELGQNARRLVELRYSVAAWSNVFIDAVCPGMTRPRATQTPSHHLPCIQNSIEKAACG